jgi:hypothetical protein
MLNLLHLNRKSQQYKQSCRNMLKENHPLQKALTWLTQVSHQNTAKYPMWYTWWTSRSSTKTQIIPSAVINQSHVCMACSKLTVWPDYCTIVAQWVLVPIAPKLHNTIQKLLYNLQSLKLHRVREKNREAPLWNPKQGDGNDDRVLYLHGCILIRITVCIFISIDSILMI